MRTTSIIEGLTILEKYRRKPHCYNCSADHDVLYAHATDTPLDANDLARMVELGWFQDTDSYEGDFTVHNYEPDEGWACYV